MRWSQVSPSKLKTFYQWMKTPPSFTHKIPAKKEQGAWGPSGDKKIHGSCWSITKAKTSKQIGTISKMMLQVGSHWNGISKLFTIQSQIPSLHPKKKNPNWSPWNQRGNLLWLNKHYKTHTNIRLTSALKEPPHRLAEFRGVQSPTKPMKLLHVF